MFRSSPFALLVQLVLILAAALPLAPVHAADATLIGPPAPARVPSSEDRRAVARIAHPSVPSAPALTATFAPTSTVAYTGTVTQRGYISTPTELDGGPERYRHTVTLLQDGTVLVTGGSDDNALDTAATFDPSTGRWQPTANMLFKRFKHTATLLQDGRVLLAGGYSGSNANGGPYLKTAEIYDPVMRRFTQTGSFEQGRENHTATLLDNGKVLIAGGQNYVSTFLYDPATGIFSRTGDLVVPRDNATATKLTDGRVLMVGGSYAHAEMYDPATGMWAYTGTAIDARTLHTATLLNDGRVLIAGAPNALVYDPTTDIWTPTKPMVLAVGNNTATLLANGTVLVAGGQATNGGVRTAQVYDPATNQWASVDDLHDARFDHKATLLPDGTVLVVSGISRVTGGVYVTSSEIYHPLTQSWTYAPAWVKNIVPQPNGDFEAARLPDDTIFLSDGRQTTVYDPDLQRFTPVAAPLRGRQYHSTTRLNDGSVLLAGGLVYPSAYSVHGSAERFDPVTRTYTMTGDLVAARQAHAATLLDDGRVLLVGGEGGLSGDTPLASAELYDPATGTFTTIGSMHEPRGSLSATLLEDGTVLVVGAGYRTGTPVSAELYDPATGTFEQLASVPQQVYERTVARLEDGTVLFVGGMVRGDRNSIPYDETNQAELYDPATRAFIPVGNLARGRVWSTATVLDDGSVLVIGGEYDNPRENDDRENFFTLTVEAYNPTTRTFANVGSIQDERSRHTTTLLDDGSLFIFGGRDINTNTPPRPERGVLSTNTFSATLVAPTGWITATSVFTVSAATTGSPIFGGSINGRPRFDLEPGVPVTQTVTGGPSGTGLPLVLRLRDEIGISANVISATADYDFQAPQTTISRLRTISPATFTLAWSGTDADSGIASYDVQVRNQTAGTDWTPLLRSTTALSTTFTGVRGTTYQFRIRARDVAGNVEEWPTTFDDSTAIDAAPPTSRMQPLPTVSPPTFMLQWSGLDEVSAIAGYDLDMRVGTDGAWTPVLTNTLALSTTFTGVRGTTYEFRVRATDTSGNVEAWPSGADTRTLVDPDPPQSTVTALPAFSSDTFVVRWTGQEAISGIVGYDLEVRDNDGAWTPVLTNTLLLSTTFTGEQGHTYQFRVRATDGAGNVEAWPTTFDTRTEVDTIAPDGSFQINDGALATTGVRVTLRLDVTDAQSGVEDVRVATNGTFGVWQPYQALLPVTLPEPDGDKEVAVQFRDVVGNVSDTITQTIQLDRSVEQNPTLSINDGALYTNVPTVTLSIGAPLNTAEMQISDNGDFKGAQWQPFDTQATWTMKTYPDDRLTYLVYVRTRDINGTLSNTLNDSIIYDPLPPTGSVTIASISASAVRVNVSASDNSTKQDRLRMRLSTDPQFGGASWQSYQPTANVPRTGGDAVRVYAQFEDAAGNRSSVGCASQNGAPCGGAGRVKVFLPLVRR